MADFENFAYITLKHGDATGDKVFADHLANRVEELLHYTKITTGFGYAETLVYVCRAGRLAENITIILADFENVDFSINYL